MDQTLEKLINMSHQLADPVMSLAILGEGNTSADCGDGTFWIKASGSQLSTITEEGFSRVNKDVVLKLLDKDLSDDEIEKSLIQSQVDPAMKKPSVETFFHALCLQETDIHWIGHTHPVSVMSILCSREGAKPFMQHIYPDEIVMCGEYVAVVPYVDPGLVLSRAFGNELKRFLDDHGFPPKLVLMENHGMVALGRQAKDVVNISKMADKWARTILGTYTMGSPRFLTAEQTKRIETRPDEEYRRKRLSSKSD